MENDGLMTELKEKAGHDDFVLGAREFVDDDVQTEIERVDAIIAGQQPQEELTVSKLKKYYKVTQNESDDKDAKKPE